jgi:hypothetical protein
MKAALRLGVLCLAAVVSRCSYDDVVTASYASRSEARESGAIDRGWIPAWMPESAADIREAHALDTNCRWGLFNFSPTDAEHIRSALAPEPVAPSEGRCEIPSRIEWWPILLRGTPDPARVRDAALESYRTKANDLVVVVNWKQGRVYYWSN